MSPWIDDLPFNLFVSCQGRLLNVSSSYASLFLSVDGMVSYVLCLQEVCQAPQHVRSSETQATRMFAALPANLSAGSFPLTPAWEEEEEKKKMPIPKPITLQSTRLFR